MKHYLLSIGKKPLLWALPLAALLGGCDALMGKEVARLPINEVSTAGHEVAKEAAVPLKKDDEIALWSDMALAYEGDAPMRFQVQVLKNGAPFKQLELDPTEKNVTVGEVKTSVNDKVNWRFSGKNAELKIPEDGTYTFKARLVATNNPTLRVTKAELVLKK
jgi:hypothetical protein